MPSPIPATAYPAPPAAYKAPARDTFAQGASGQDMAVLNVATNPASEARETTAAPTKEGAPLFGKDGFTFGDFLDIINPLQHIPVVSTVYRALTGDKIDPGSRVIGGGLFGGPIGLVASMVSGMVEEATGKDPGEHVLAALGINMGPGNTELQTMLADAGKQLPAEMTPAELTAFQAQAAEAQSAQAKAQPAGQEMKLGVMADDGRTRNPAEQARQAVKSNGPVELPSDLFQALRQTAATQQQDTRTTAANAATANPVLQQQQQSRARSTGPMQSNTASSVPNTGIPPTAIQPGGVQTTGDGRSWYPAFPTSGGNPARGAGTSPVTQLNATSKFGVTKGASGTPQAATASTAAMIQNIDSPQNEWSNRATEAYQKYFEMQNEKNRRAGVVQ